MKDDKWAISDRFPNRERELKQYLAKPAGIGYRSLPTQGARIEMVIDAELIPAALSLPTQGARIEILF